MKKKSKIQIQHEVTLDECPPVDQELEIYS